MQAAQPIQQESRYALHMDLYSQSFIKSVPIKHTIDGERLDTCYHEGANWNLGLNFSDPAPFYENLNPLVKLNYALTNIREVVDSLSKALGEVHLNQESLRQNGGEEVLKLLKNEAEIWSLMRYLHLADRVSLSNDKVGQQQ